MNEPPIPCHEATSMWYLIRRQKWLFRSTKWPHTSQFVPSQQTEAAAVKFIASGSLSLIRLKIVHNGLYSAIRKLSFQSKMIF